MTRKKTETINFEEAKDKLNELVDKLEQGGLSLEDSLKAFEEGVGLTRQCQKALKDAEQKVQILLEKNGEQNLDPYRGEE